MRAMRLQELEEKWGLSYKRPLASFHRGQTATTYFRRSGDFVRR